MPSSIIIMIAVSGSDSSIYKTLESLEKCELPVDIKVEIFLIENGPKSKLKNNLSHYNLNIRYFYTPIPNKSKALNLGLKEVKGDALVIFTDADIKFNDKFILFYYDIAKQYPIGYYYGGALEVEYEGKPKKWFMKSLPASAKGWNYTETSPNLQKQFFLGCNWAAFNRDLKKTGGFNEQIGPGTKPRRVGQETDMQIRLKINNIKPLFVSQNVVSHYVPKYCLNIKWILRRKYQEGFSIGMGFRKDDPVNLKGILINLSKRMLKVPFSLIFLSNDDKLYSIALFVESMGRISGYIYRLKNRSHFT